MSILHKPIYKKLFLLTFVIFIAFCMTGCVNKDEVKSELVSLYESEDFSSAYTLLSEQKENIRDYVADVTNEALLDYLSQGPFGDVCDTSSNLSAAIKICTLMDVDDDVESLYRKMYDMEVDSREWKSYMEVSNEYGESIDDCISLLDYYTNNRNFNGVYVTGTLLNDMCDEISAKLTLANHGKEYIKYLDDLGTACCNFSKNRNSENAAVISTNVQQLSQLAINYQSFLEELISLFEEVSQFAEANGF